MDMNIYIEKLKKEIQETSLSQWIRLGICFGMFRWIRYVSNLLMSSRAMEKIMTINQIQTFYIKENLTIPNNYLDIYFSSFLFESILIFIIMYGLWGLLIWKFGLPKYLIKKK